MKILKTTLTVFLILTIILWGMKLTSPNLRIKGYFGILSEYLFPDHDTVFSEKYSDEAFLMIRKGMTEKEVIDILGEPLLRWTPKDNYVGLQYTESKGSTHYRLRQIYLTGGEVKEIIGYYYID